MTVPHERLREWIISKLNQKNVFGLEWHDQSKMHFKVIWLHQRNSEWRDEFGQVFMEWAQHTGKYHPGDKKEYSQWKTTLRNALHKCEEFKEIHKSSPKAKPYPYKIYQILERKRKKTPARVTNATEPQPFVLPTESPRNLPVMIDDMSSPDSSLASPPQQVPGTINTWNKSNYGDDVALTSYGDSSTSEHLLLDHLQASPELKLNSSEFEMLLKQVNETSASKCTTAPSASDTASEGDILKQIVDQLDIPSSEQIATNLANNLDQELTQCSANQKHDAQALVDPAFGVEQLDHELLDTVLPMSIEDDSLETALKCIMDETNTSAPGQPSLNATVPSARDEQAVQGSQPSTKILNLYRDSKVDGNGQPEITSNLSDFLNSNEYLNNPQCHGQENVLANSTLTNIASSNNGHLQKFGMAEPGDGTVLNHQTENYTTWRDQKEEESLKKYNYPELPEHCCEQQPCNLHLELLYLENLVKKWNIGNPNGCRVHTKIDRSILELWKTVGYDIESFCGTNNIDSCKLPEWPSQIKVKSPDKVAELFKGLRRGFLVKPEGGNIHITRLSKCELFYSTAACGNFSEISRTKENNAHKEIKVFDYDQTFLAALQQYKSGSGPKPSTGVYIQMGQKPVNRSKLFLVLRVTSCQALRDLHRVERENEEKSLSLQMSSGDSFDKVESLLTQLNKSLTLPSQ